MRRHGGGVDPPAWLSAGYLEVDDVAVCVVCMSWCWCGVCVRGSCVCVCVCVCVEEGACRRAPPSKIFISANTSDIYVICPGLCV